MVHRYVTLALVIVCMYVIGWATNAIATDSTRVRVPVCAEDEPYLRGKGDYSDGAWSRYVCVHIDDIRRV